MQNNIINYRVDIEPGSMTLRINKGVVFDAKISGLFWREKGWLLWRDKYLITEQVTNQKFKLVVFRKNLLYYGEEKVELYNEDLEIIMKFRFEWDYVKFIFSKIYIFEDAKKISLSNPVKKQLIYRNGENIELNGNYEQFLPIPNELTYYFSANEELKEPFQLMMSCFCHKVLLRRRGN
jgi:hypothetical protein